MNILIVSQYFWPENFKINDVAQGLVDKGHNVSVLTGLPNYPKGKFYKGYSFPRDKKENHEGVTIYRSPVIPRGNGSSIRLFLKRVPPVETMSTMASANPILGAISTEPLMT